MMLYSDILVNQKNTCHWHVFETTYMCTLTSWPLLLQEAQRNGLGIGEQPTLIPVPLIGPKKVWKSRGDAELTYNNTIFLINIRKIL